MESALIAWLRQRLPPHPLLRLGPGDDAAVLRPAGGEDIAVTVDLLTDHVDFELSEADPRRVGRKALAVNLSDLAAMASRPLAGVVALALPRRGGLELAKSLYEGMLPLAEEFELAIAGGDTNSWDGPLVISVTLLGQVPACGPLRRGGAKPGDRILVTGSFGGSILGRHFDFRPRVHEALLLNERYELHAGIDASDGLSIDLMHLCEESRCGAVVRTDLIPVSGDAGRVEPVMLKHNLRSEHAPCSLRPDEMTPLDHALGDGEDFELILAVPPDEAQRILAEQPLDVALTDIGCFTADPGLRQSDAAGTLSKLVPRGWEHQFE
jgi:thiamine-monophosphate kinase